MKLKVLTVAAVAAVAVAAPAMTQQDRRPDLVVGSMTEPPDAIALGAKFRMTFSVSNDGNARARGSVTRGYLSRDRTRSSDDRRLDGRRRMLALRRDEQETGTVSLDIPDDTTADTYYLLLCADDGDAVRESDERDNCTAGGQRMAVGVRPEAERGPVGPAGPVGEKGEPGAPGEGAEAFRRLPRTVMTPAEGATDESDVLTVGPFRFRYECENGAGTGLDVARLIVVSDSGTMSVQGHHTDPAEGRQPNVPAGTEAIVMRAARESNDGASTVEDDPNTTNDESSGGNFSGFKGKRSYASHDTGAEVVIDAFAGVDTLGVGEPEPGNSDQCILGGNVTVLAP